MKHQYVGDINDYRKYALLRALSAGGVNQVGVCWMLTPDDGSTDGNKLAYLRQPDRYRSFDTELFEVLADAAGEPDRRRLHTIEDSGAVSRALYHNDTLPQSIGSRAAYMASCRAKFADTDLVFFDPDTGLEPPSARKTRKIALKYVFLDEIAAFYGDGKSALIYQHFTREERLGFIRSQVQRLRHIACDAAIWLFRTEDVVFFLLLHPESPARLAIAAMEACGRLDPSFVRGEYLPHTTSPAT
jgi:hypothetical protein